jgi:hypothetical protein
MNRRRIWFLVLLGLLLIVTPRFERSVSPLPTMTVEESIRQLLALGTEEARREAEEAFPGHPLLTAAPRP